jgi:thymidylate synthase (FAD)
MQDLLETALPTKKLSVLDHGFVELIDTLGDDLTVVNAARVSFGKRKTELDEGDKKLITYLARHEHWSPFRHVQLQFHCKVPEFVARQWYKHVVGIAYTDGASVDHAWNEISLRYVDASEFQFYEPYSPHLGNPHLGSPPVSAPHLGSLETVTEQALGFRQQSANNKQASTDDVVPDTDQQLRQAYRKHGEQALALYQQLLEAGVAREQARGVLPLSIYTEFYWTASLQALVNFIRLRQHPGAQYEIRLYADALEQLVKQVVPVSYAGLLQG